MRITFVRHGESEANVTGRWQGQGDSPLSPMGRSQARSLAERLAGAKIDAVVSSDLTRAAETARALGVDITLEPAFREVDVGDWEGLDRAEVADRFPEQVAGLAEGRSDVKIGGGESWDDLYVRIDAALSALTERHAGAEHVAVFSHGGVITSLFAGLLGIRGQHPRPLGRVVNTSMSTVHIAEGERTLERWNDATHLGPLGSWASARLSRGDAVVGLVSHEVSEQNDAPPAGGRLRGGPGVLAVEHLAEWYRDLDRLYADASSDSRNAAAMLAHRAGVRVSDEPIDRDALATSVRRLGERHGGERVGAVLSPRTIGDWAEALIEPGPGARLGAPRHATVSHVVITSGGVTLADYAVSPRLG